MLYPRRGGAGCCLSGNLLIGWFTAGRNKTMEFIRFEKVSGEGNDALYNLYLDNELAAEAVSMDEVMQRINSAYEDKENTRM